MGADIPRGAGRMDDEARIGGMAVTRDRDGNLMVRWAGPGPVPPTSMSDERRAMRRSVTRSLARGLVQIVAVFVVICGAAVAARWAGWSALAWVGGVAAALVGLFAVLHAAISSLPVWYLPADRYVTLFGPQAAAFAAAVDGVAEEPGDAAGRRLWETAADLWISVPRPEPADRRSFFRRREKNAG